MAVEAVNSVANRYGVQGSTSSAQHQTEEVAEAKESKSDSSSAAERFSVDDVEGQARNNEQATNSAVREAASKITSNIGNTEAVFGYHEETNRITIKIVDKETKDVIKEVPAEETLDLIAKAWEMAGILVDEKR